jgi:predicted transcriptional regulator
MDENENKLFDFNTLQRILNFNKSKLYRELNKLDEVEPVKYKNQNLYEEKVLFQLMKKKLIKRLNENG